MPIDFPLGGGFGAPVTVFSDSDRNLRFPSPNVNQIVYNIGTGAVQRWTGATWNNDLLFAGGLTPEVFNALATLAAGVAVSGTAASSGFPDYVTLNSARQGGQVGYSLYGTNPNGANDVRVYNDGSGNFVVAVASVPMFQVDTQGNIYQLKTGANWYPQVGGHQNIDGWSVTNIANAQNNVQMTRTITQWAGTRAGWITGVAIRGSAAMTGGAGNIATVTVYKNGVATTVVASAQNGVQFNSLNYPPPAGGAIAFNAGDLLDARISTAAGWTFTTGTVFATIEVLS